MNRVKLRRILSDISNLTNEAFRLLENQKIAKAYFTCQKCGRHWDDNDNRVILPNYAKYCGSITCKECRVKESKHG